MSTVNASRRESAFRAVVRRIPLLPRIYGGEGGRFELKIDITPDAISVTAQDENHHQVKGTREYYDRTIEENPALICAHLCEVVGRALRDIPRRET